MRGKGEATELGELWRWGASSWHDTGQRSWLERVSLLAPEPGSRKGDLVSVSLILREEGRKN